MNRLRLRNLAYHWRANSAVFLGVVVSTAVLTGALLVGDALRGSLRRLALQRLGWIDQAMIGGRFIGVKAIDLMYADGLAPAIVLRASASFPEETRSIRNVNLFGVNERFWLAGRKARPYQGHIPPWPNAADVAGNPVTDERLPGLNFWSGHEEGVVLNRALADELRVTEGDTVVLRVARPGDVAPETLLGRRDPEAVVGDLIFTVHAILPDDAFGARFNMQPSVEMPRNAFVPLGALQELIKQPDRINAVFAAGQQDCQVQLHARLDLDDWGLKVRNIHGYLSLESRQLLLEPFVVAAARTAAEETDLHVAPTLVYLANTISDGQHEIPYSIVAALNPTEAPPLGPFLPEGVHELCDDQIVLVDWKGCPIQAKAGKSITLRYFPPEQHGDFKEVEAEFKMAGDKLLPLTGAAADPDLTPVFPGVTDKPLILDWDPPFPFDRKRIKPNDANEKFWKEHRTTPKAYVKLKKGQELWGSRFGNLTSIRMAPAKGNDLAASLAAFNEKLRDLLLPEKGGLTFEPVKADALVASAGGTDFAQLFLGFSFFLIIAALLLVGLLFRLNLDRRSREIGLLLAAGYRGRTVTWLLLSEGLVLATLGAALGCAVAVGYAALLVKVLAALWPGGALKSFLQPDFSESSRSLLIGYAASVLVSVLTIAWALRSLSKVPPRALLAGQTTVEREPGAPVRPRWSWRIAAGAVVGAVALLACSGLVKDHEAKAGTFFGSGALLLTAALAALSGWMRGSRHHTVEGRGWWSVARLGVRNASRYPLRSLLTTGLLASAAFLLVAVEAFRREADAGDLSPQSPSGGFNLLAESDLPIFVDLNSEKGRNEIADKLQVAFQRQPGNEPRTAKKQTAEAMGLLGKVSFVALRARAGDDASCLNLYQPRRPRLLGVPAEMPDPGDPSKRIPFSGFQFAATLAPATAAERDNPWRILRREGEPIPAFGEKNTVEWMLKTSLDANMTIQAGDGSDRSLLIAGLLQDSVFQSSLLVSEEHFLQLYPGHKGYNVFLIRAPAGKEQEVKRLLETGLADRGFAVTPTAERLEAYLAVENTYLSTFQALGGLGLLLGSLGLAIVLLRSVWERRGELALLRALGFRRSVLGWLVLAENGFLLIVGLGAGTLCALLSVAPHLLGGAGALPWAHLLILLAIVLLVGLIAGMLAIASTLRAPLIPALRNE
jgi:ABC-type antimicrobial peptide transport system permease subunit